MSHDPTIMATLELLAERWLGMLHRFEAQHDCRLRSASIRTSPPPPRIPSTPDELNMPRCAFYCGNLDYLRACHRRRMRVLDLDGNAGRHGHRG